MPPGARIVRDRAHALRVSVPPDWQRSRSNLIPRMAGPGSILTVATFAARARTHRTCGDWPDMPQAPVGPHDALLHVEEEIDAQPGRLPARPRRFKLFQQLRRPGTNDRFSVFPWRCLNRVGIVGLRTWFRAHGRLVHVTAIAGERTSRRLRRELLGILESLSFGPPAPVEVSVRPSVGDPTTRFRLEFVSTHRAGGRGRPNQDYRREQSYWAAVHGPQRIACVIENEARFSNGPAGARLHAVLDPSRTKGGRWCRGLFTGIVTYRDGICAPDGGSCDRMYTRRAGRFSFTVR
jgi:hypothetical protein